MPVQPIVFMQYVHVYFNRTHDELKNTTSDVHAIKKSKKKLV